MRVHWSTWQVFTPTTIPKCTLATLDAQLMDKVCRKCNKQMLSLFHNISPNNKTIIVFFFFSLSDQHPWWCNEGCGETKPHGEHEGEFTFKVSNGCVLQRCPPRHLLSTCLSRISAWTMASVLKSQSTPAAVCSLQLGSWPHCGQKIKKLSSAC